MASRVEANLILVFLSVLSATGVTSNCQAGWVAHGNSCYLFAQNLTRTFSEAEQYCRQYNAYLVQTETRNENFFIRHRLRELKYEHHWLGLTDQKNENVWKWQTTGAAPSFTDWIPGEPNSWEGNEDCAIFSDVADYRWADFNCTGKAEPICEITVQGAIVG